MTIIPKALTIAGSDSGGGAGIQADLKTFASLGVYGVCALTAITAQNSKEVTAISEVPLDVLRAQIDAVLTDIGADAVKIGMLATQSIIGTVKQALTDHHCKTVVLDPVMVAASGAKLLADDAIDALKTELFPLATLVTPNLPEAELIVGRKIESKEDIEQAGKDILSLGAQGVLIKGGHLDGESVYDYFSDGSQSFTLEHDRIDKEGHGTGCTLSSAIAAHLAKGHTLEESVRLSVDYVHQALQEGMKVGSQNYVLHHFFEK